MDCPEELKLRMSGFLSMETGGLFGEDSYAATGMDLRQRLWRWF